MNTCISEFWNYFQQNQFAFQLLKEIDLIKRTELLNELNRLIRNFHPKIGVLIKTTTDGFELIVTAYGNPYVFKSVELLVLYAPMLPQWTITAFIQPFANLSKYKSGTDEPFVYGGMSFKISSLKYQTVVTENNPLLTTIIVLLPNLVLHRSNEHLTTAVYIILEHLLGEKSFANEIHTVKIDQLTTENENAGTYLHHLPTYLKIIRGLTAQELSL